MYEDLSDSAILEKSKMTDNPKKKKAWRLAIDRRGASSEFVTITGYTTALCGIIWFVNLVTHSWTIGVRNGLIALIVTALFPAIGSLRIVRSGTHETTNNDN